MTFRPRALFVLWLLLAGLPGLATAQSRTGTIFGTIRDATGGVLPGVAVVATEQDTGVSRDTTTDAQGRFEFLLLPIGRYSIKSTIQGFSEFEVKNVGLETQQNREVSITMQPAGVQES